MPNVEIIGPDTGDTSMGTLLLVDGVEVEYVREIVLTIAVDALATVRTEVLASGKLQFRGRADLHVTVVAEPGHEIIHTVDADGTDHYRSAPLSSLESHVEG